MKNLIKLHFWKTDIKKYEKVKIDTGCYIYKWQYEQQKDYQSRKNDSVSFGIFDKCITIHYRKLPPLSKKIAPNFSTCINLRLLPN